MKTSLLRVLLGAGIGSTAIHYTDNAIAIDEYPQPSWITEPVVFAVLIAFTAAGIAGYLLYARGRTWPAIWLLIAYSYTGLSSLLHYRYGAVSDLALWRQVAIWTDGLTGACVLAFALYTGLSITKAPARTAA